MKRPGMFRPTGAQMRLQNFRRALVGTARGARAVRPAGFRLLSVLISPHDVELVRPALEDMLARDTAVTVVDKPSGYLGVQTGDTATGRIVTQEVEF